MKYMKLFGLLCMFLGALHAEQKQVTILVGGTGTGYQSKILKFARYCPRGLHKMTAANELKMGNFYTSKYTIFSKSKSGLFDKDHIYNFGWAGQLGFDLRDQEGKILAQAVEELAKEYKSAYQEYPHVRIVTFSHGGNVALNMGKYFSTFEEPMNIDLIMFAPPIQAATSNLVHSPCFSHVYNIFSDGDVIQRIDPQNMYAPIKNDTTFIFSERFFLNPPVNCKQARITIKGNCVGHLELCHGLAGYLQNIVQQLDNHKDTSICSINIADENYLTLTWYNFLIWYYAHCK